MTERRLLTAGSKSSPLVATLSEYEGNRLLDFRKYFRDKQGELKPTRKGIALSLFQYEQICSLIAKSNSEIVNWLKPEAHKEYKKSEIQAEVSARFTKPNESISGEKKKGIELLEYTVKGAKLEINVNANNSWGEKYRELKNSNHGEHLALVDELIVALIYSVMSLDTSDEYAEEILDTLMMNIGSFIDSRQGVKNKIC